MFDKILELLPEQKGPKPNDFTIYMGNAIKEAREEAGMSQADLAEKIYRRRATLSDIETGKADVDAWTLWVLSVYLQKPLSFFYPSYARKTMIPEERGDLEHELLLHFKTIEGENFKKLVIQLVRVISKFDPKDFYLELKPFMEERLERERVVQELADKHRKKKS